MTCNLRALAYPACGLAFVLSLSTSAFAQPVAKTLAESNKVIVTEGTLGAGATAKIAAPQGPFFTRYYLTGGKLEYTYSDGKKETVTRKNGTAIIITATDKRPVTAKNIGATDLHYITVGVK